MCEIHGGLGHESKSIWVAIVSGYVTCVLTLKVNKMLVLQTVSPMVVFSVKTQMPKNTVCFWKNRTA